MAEAECLSHSESLPSDIPRELEDDFLEQLFSVLLPLPDEELDRFSLVSSIVLKFRASQIKLCDTGVGKEAGSRATCVGYNTDSLGACVGYKADSWATCAGSKPDSRRSLVMPVIDRQGQAVLEENGVDAACSKASSTVLWNNEL